MDFLFAPAIQLAANVTSLALEIASPRPIFHAFKNAVSDLAEDFEEIWIPCYADGELFDTVTLWDESEPRNELVQPVDQLNSGNPLSTTEVPETQERSHRFCSQRTASNQQSIIGESCELRSFPGTPRSKASIYWTNFLRSSCSKMSFSDEETYNLETFDLFEEEMPHDDSLLPFQTRRRRNGTTAVVRVQHYLLFQNVAEQRLKGNFLVIAKFNMLVQEKHHGASLLALASNAMETFFSHFRNLDEMYCDLRGPDTLRMALMLQYHHAHLITFAAFLCRFEQAYLNVRRMHYDPRQHRLKQWHLQGITEDSVALEKYHFLGKEIMERLETLMDVIRLVTDPQKHLGRAEVNIRILNRETNGMVSRMRDGLEHDLKFLNLARDMAQTSSVRHLTLLATIFLPLSLSAGVLSMQTRFRDLGPLLYDFIGVVVLLGALVFPFVAFLSILELVTGYLVQKAEADVFEGEQDLREFRNHKRKRRHFVRIFWLVLALVSVFVFITFMLGIFQNVELGAKVLGIGFAVLFALGLLIVILGGLGILGIRFVFS